MDETNIWEGLPDAPDPNPAQSIDDLMAAALKASAAAELTATCAYIALGPPAQVIHDTLAYLLESGRKSPADLLVSHSVH